MPIFSSQLGKVDGQTPQEGIKTLANHLRKIQEELEYRLMNLDSSNVTEIVLEDTSMTLGGKPIQNIIAEGGNYSALEQTVDGLRAIVANMETGMAHMLQMDASGVYIVDQNGNAVVIHGGQIDANTLNLKGYISFDDLTDGVATMSKINYAYNTADSAYGLAEAAYALAENAELPDYIHSTHISKAEIRSPSIFGGMFYATGRGKYTEAAYYLYDSWSASKGLGNQVGYLSYDDDGEGTTEEAAKRVLLTSTNGTALKIHAAGNMSLESGDKIYMMSKLVTANKLILTRSINFGASLPSSGTNGELFFVIA